MDAQIIAAIIVAIAAVIGAVIGTISAQRTKTRLKKVEDETLDVSESLRGEIETFGYKISSVLSKMRMTNMQGATEVTRTYRGVKVVRSGVTITHIPGRIWVDHPTGKITTCPQLTDTPSLPAKAVELKIVTAEDKECVFNIEITGGLTNSDPGLDYEFQTTYSKGICVTKEEMEEAYKQADFKKEYHSFDIVSPIDILDLEVAFPEGYLVQAYPVVFYLNSELIINRELERIKVGFDKSGTSAKLRVEQPKIGFRYAIYWLPPSSREIEKLA